MVVDHNSNSQSIIELPIDSLENDPFHNTFLFTDFKF